MWWPIHGRLVLLRQSIDGICFSTAEITVVLKVSHMVFTSAPPWSMFTIFFERSFRSVLRSSHFALEKR